MCSCPPDELETSHDPYCQCTCANCKESRSCPCTGDSEKCVCPLMCNCSCTNCHTDTPERKRSRPFEAKDGDHDCERPGCKNIVRKRFIRCPKCEKRRKANRECATTACSRLAPIGSYTGHGIYCAECCKDPLVRDPDDGCRRVCTEDGCDKLSPVGCVSSPRCHNCQSDFRLGSKKRKRDAEDMNGKVKKSKKV